MTKELLPSEEAAIAGYVRNRLKGEELAHDFSHIECVVGLAKKIGQAENANLRIVVPAAYLHDVVSRGDVKKFDDHTAASAKEAEKLLRELNFDADDIYQIKQAIIRSSYESYEKGLETTTLEEKVVRDADWLDAIGARGIGRVFAACAEYGSHEMGNVELDPENPPKLKMNHSAADPSPIYHFFSKLLHLADKMQTETGRAIAEERHNVMVEFLKRYKAECEGTK